MIFFFQFLDFLHNFPPISVFWRLWDSVVWLQIFLGGDSKTCDFEGVCQSPYRKNPSSKFFLGIKKNQFCLLTPYFFQGGISIFFGGNGRYLLLFRERYFGGMLGFQQGGGIGATPAGRPETVTTNMEQFVTLST